MGGLCTEASTVLFFQEGWGHHIESLKYFFSLIFVIQNFQNDSIGGSFGSIGGSIGSIDGIQSFKIFKMTHIF